MSHSRCCIRNKNRARDRIRLRDKVCRLYGRLKSRNYSTRDCTGRYSRIQCLYDGRSRLCRYRGRDECTCWLDGCLSDCLAWQSLRSRDVRG